MRGMDAEEWQHRAELYPARIEFRVSVSGKTTDIGAIKSQPRQAGIDHHADRQFQVIPRRLIVSCPCRSVALDPGMSRPRNIEGALTGLHFFECFPRGAGH